MFDKCTCFFRLKNKKEYELFFENVKNINVNLYSLNLNSNLNSINSYDFKNLLNNKIKIPNESFNNNSKYIFIELISNETCDKNFVFTLKNIL